jgi:hypothetical protein
VEYPYYYAWRNNEKRATLYKRKCRVVARGSMNSCLVEFDNGEREIISRNAIRKNAPNPRLQATGATAADLFTSADGPRA